MEQPAADQRIDFDEAQRERAQRIMALFQDRETRGSKDAERLKGAPGAGRSAWN
jgi:hypothetical protein